VPGTVTIPAGATSQTFTIATVNVPPSATVTISATYGGSTQSLPLTVWAYPVVASLQCSPANPTGGATLQCSGMLTSSPNGWTLALATDNSAASVPASVTVPPGGTTFQFAVATTSVSSATTFTIQVTDAPTGLVIYRSLITLASS